MVASGWGMEVGGQKWWWMVGVVGVVCVVCDSCGGLKMFGVCSLLVVCWWILTAGAGIEIWLLYGLLTVVAWVVCMCGLWYVGVGCAGVLKNCGFSQTEKRRVPWFTP